MSKDNNYNNTTKTLKVENRQLDGVIFHPTKPVLDSELNLSTDISSARIQDFIRSKIPSGFLDGDYDIGFDSAHKTFGVNTCNEPNTFYLWSKKTSPILVNVNGWVIPLGGTNISDDSLVKIQLDEAPGVLFREDLVFLEVWKAEFGKNVVKQEKPTSTTIYKYGNTQYGGVNLDDTDETVNPSVGFETTSRVQIQYRVRVASGVDFSGFPEGIDDTNTVRAWGGNFAATSYAFSNAFASFNDAGLYVAGDGSTSAKTTLNTVDGFVYAIPLFRVHRRNKVAFAINNQNGALKSVLSGELSDRPDGLFYDQIHDWDIEDLRHKVSFYDWDYQEFLEDNFDNLCAGRLNTCLIEQLDSSLLRKGTGFYITKISADTQSGTENIGISPNGEQRYYSDISKSVKNVRKFIIADSSVPGPTWSIPSTITLTPKTPSPSGTIITNLTPTVLFNNAGTVSAVSGTWAGLGTNTAVFTLSATAGLTDQPIYVSFEITYPQVAYKLNKPVTDILRIEEKSNQDNRWGFRSVLDYDSDFGDNPNRREMQIPETYIVNTPGLPVNYAFTYNLSSKGVSDPYCGTVVSYFMRGNNTTTYTLPASIINYQDVAYVLSVYNHASQTPYDVTCTKDFSNRIDVTLPTTIDSGQILRFDIVLFGGVLEYDSRTQSITDMGKVSTYEIYGNNTTDVILENCITEDPNQIILGSQMLYFNNAFTTYCWILDFGDTLYRQTWCNVTITPNSNIIKLNFPLGPVPNNSKINISLLTNYALDQDNQDDLNIMYNFKEYVGITNKFNFTSASRIDSKIKYHKEKLGITTSGTGAINSDLALPSAYEPLIPVLPLSGNVTSSGIFNGTLHTSKLIIGGNYSLTGSPYCSGKPNYMLGVTSQGRGSQKGSYFATNCGTDYSGTNRVVYGALVEQVINDTSKNFAKGEIALKVETNYLSSISTAPNQITNYSGTGSEVNNSYDLFKIKGRPLVK